MVRRQTPLYPDTEARRRCQGARTSPIGAWQGRQEEWEAWAAAPAVRRSPRHPPGLDGPRDSRRVSARARELDRLRLCGVKMTPALALIAHGTLSPIGRGRCNRGQFLVATHAPLARHRTAVPLAMETLSGAGIGSGSNCRILHWCLAAALANKHRSASRSKGPVAPERGL